MRVEALLVEQILGWVLQALVVKFQRVTLQFSSAELSGAVKQSQLLANWFLCHFAVVMPIRIK